MNKLYFYKVDKQYADYLYNYEMQARGFSRVPKFDYVSPNKEKFTCGILLQVGNLDYLAPVSSYKTKQENNVLLIGRGKKVLGSIRLNYMFPVLVGHYTYFNFGNEADLKYKGVLQQEWASINRQDRLILSKAKSTYKTVCNLKASGQDFKWACDFPLLEEAAAKYNHT